MKKMQKHPYTRQRKFRHSLSLKRLLLYTLLIVVAILVLSPLFSLIATSIRLKDVEMAAVKHLKLPDYPIFSNYINILFKKRLLRNFFTSLLIALCSTSICVIIGSFGAYTFARFKFGISSVLLLIVLFMRMIPRISLIVPIYLLFKTIGLLDTRFGLIIVHSAIQLPFVVWMLASFFEQIPQEIDEAASIDGCSLLQVFTRIIIPLSKTALAVAAILSFIASWNEFLFALILTHSVAQTVPVVLAQYVTGRQIYWGPLSAGGVLFTVPVLLFSLLVQKHIVKGMSFGAIKG